MAQPLGQVALLSLSVALPCFAEQTAALVAVQILGLHMPVAMLGTNSLPLAPAEVALVVMVALVGEEGMRITHQQTMGSLVQVAQEAEEEVEDIMQIIFLPA